MKIQGIQKYCGKEGYMVEIIKNKKEIFKNIIGSSIKEIYSEVRFNKNTVRVDLVGEVEEGSLVFIEVSIRNYCIKDYVNHRHQLISILKIIGKDSYAQIILMSPDFLNDDIKYIEKLISTYNVKVYFVYIPIELIIRLQNNTNTDFIEKKELLYDKFTIGKCIKVTSKTLDTNNIFIFNLNNEQCGNSISKDILSGLRKKIYWHLTVHRYKSLKRNIIKIGTGTSDIILNIYCNMNDKIRVEVDFAQRFNVFNIFKDYMADMSDEVGTSIDIDPNTHQIFTEIPILKSRKTTIDTAINTATGYLEYITKMYRKIQL